MSKQKYYVVWKGHNTGIYNSWNDCEKQVKGYSGARYKSFLTYDDAYNAYYDIEIDDRDYIEHSISVDAACSGKTGDLEYRGVFTDTSEEMFSVGIIPNGTNNIGEFLAIVHALALMKQKGEALPIYSDSVTALAWVRDKKANTSLTRNKSTKRVWSLIDRAENWLNRNSYNNQLLKWHTKRWGESKADYGRK